MVFWALYGTLAGSRQTCFVSPKTHGNALFWESQFQERVSGDQGNRETPQHAYCQSISEKRAFVREFIRLSWCHQAPKFTHPPEFSTLGSSRGLTSETGCPG